MLALQIVADAGVSAALLSGLTGSTFALHTDFAAVARHK
jgi:hypothetical protein